MSCFLFFTSPETGFRLQHLVSTDRCLALCEAGDAHLHSGWPIGIARTNGPTAERPGDQAWRTDPSRETNEGPRDRPLDRVPSRVPPPHGDVENPMKTNVFVGGTWPSLGQGGRCPLR